MPVDANDSPILLGSLAREPDAPELAADASYLIHRYASEVVAPFELCPHLRGVDEGLGALCIVLDRVLDPAAIAGAVRATGSKVVHVVFPLVGVEASVFERFGNAVAEHLGTADPRLVHATFHPEMEGGDEYASRIVGLVRRSPDPLVQFIPHGIQQGGTTIFGAPPATATYLESTYRRVRGPLLAQIIDRQVALHDERRLRYAKYGDRLGPFTWYGVRRAAPSSQEASS